MKNLTKLTLLFAAIMMTVSSCNLDTPNIDQISDFGVIYTVTSDLEYTVKTDFNGTIYSYKTPIAVKKDQIGKRVRVVFNVVTDGDSVSDTFAEIISLGTVNDVMAISQTEIDQMNAEEKAKFDETIGDTPMDIRKIQYVNGKINFTFMTVSSETYAKGTPVLVFDDVNSTATKKVYQCYYKASASASNLVTDYFTANVLSYIPGQKYEVEITFKPLGDISTGILNFDVDLTK